MSFAVRAKLLSPAVASFFISGILFYLIFLYFSTKFDESREHVSFMRPKYVEIVNDNPGHPNLPYRLFLYIEATNEINLQNENLNQVNGKNFNNFSRFNRLFSGIPVIFIHGNAGSYRQCRSFASYSEKIKSRFDIKFDYFCIDFAEELSAFSGQILERQVEYLTEIVKFLSGLYSSIGNKQEIILIGHSMGGIVAKGAVYMDHQLLAHADVPSAVKMVITLNTPHARCLGALDRKFEDLFSKIHQSHLSKIVRIPNGDAGANVVPPLISFSPGTRDIIVPSELSIVEESDLQFTLNVMTSEMPLVWASMEHQMSVWNFPFIKAVHIGLIFGLQNEKLRNRKNPSLSSKALLSDLSTYWKSGNIIDDEPDVSNIPAREVSYSSTKSGRDDIYYQEILLPANGDIYLDHNDLAGLIGNNRHFALILKSASSSAAQFSTSLQPVKDHIIIENITSIEVENGKLRAVSGLMGPHMNLPESFYPAGSKSFCLNSVYSSINIPFHSQLKRDIILPAMIIILPFRATSLDQSYMFLPPSHSVFESFSPFVNFSGSNSYLDSMVHSEETQFLSSKLNYHQKSRFSSLLSWASSPSSYISIISNKKSLPVDPSAAKLSVKLSFGLLDYFFAYFLNYDAISVASSSCSMSQIKISILNLRPKYQVLRLTVFLRAKSDVIANSPPNAIQAFFHSQVEKKYLDIKPESVVTRGGSNTYRFSHLISLQDAKPGAPLDPLIIKMLIDPRYEVHESILFTPEKLLGISLAFKWYFPWIMYFYPVIFCLFAVSLQASANSKLPVRKMIFCIAVNCLAIMFLRMFLHFQMNIIPSSLEYLLMLMSLYFTVSFLSITEITMELVCVVFESLYYLLGSKSPFSFVLFSIFNQLDRLVLRVGLFLYVVFPFHPNLFIYFLGVIYFHTRKRSSSIYSGLICSLSLFGMMSSVHSAMILIKELGWKWKSHPFSYFPNESLVLLFFETSTFNRLINMLPKRLIGPLLMSTTFALWLVTICTNPVLSACRIYIYPIVIYVFLLFLQKHRSLNKCL